MPFRRGCSKPGSRNSQRSPAAAWSQKWTWASVNGSVGRLGHDGRDGQDSTRGPGVNVIGMANVP